MKTNTLLAVAIVVAAVIIASAVVVVFYDKDDNNNEQTILPIGYGNDQRYDFKVYTEFSVNGDTRQYESFASLQPLFRTDEGLYTKLNLTGPYLSALEYWGSPDTLLPIGAEMVGYKTALGTPYKYIELHEYKDPKTGAIFTFEYNTGYKTINGFECMDTTMTISDGRYAATDVYIIGSYVGTFDRGHYVEGDSVGKTDVFDMSGSTETITKNINGLTSTYQNRLEGRVKLETVAHNASEGAQPWNSLYREVEVTTDDGRVYLSVYVPSDPGGTYLPGSYRNYQLYTDANDVMHIVNYWVALYEDTGTLEAFEAEGSITTYSFNTDGTIEESTLTEFVIHAESA